MIGTQIGDLKLVRLLAEGGMGAVYLAEHLLLNDFQAVKILNPLVIPILCGDQHRSRQ